MNGVAFRFHRWSEPATHRVAGRSAPRAALSSVIVATIALATLSGCQSAGASGSCSPGEPKRVGHYYLNGVMEVGSELLLNGDGSFEFMLAYGALDQYGKGCWRVEGDKLLVIPEGRSAPAPQYSMEDSRFVGFTLTIEGNDLIWQLGGGHHGRYEKG